MTTVAFDTRPSLSARSCGSARDEIWETLIMYGKHESAYAYAVKMWPGIVGDSIGP